MTQTSFDIEFLTGCSEVLPNDVLEQVMLAAYKDVGAPKFTPEDYAFGRKNCGDISGGSGKGS